MDAGQALELWPRTTIDVNPLEAAEHHWFQLHVTGDYRHQAIDDVAKRDLPFTSTVNCIFTVAELFIPIMICPYCKAKGKQPYPTMESTGHGGGNGVTFSVGYRCTDCGATAGLTFTAEGISFRPKGS